MKLLTQLNTIRSLGWNNCIAVAIHRFKLRIGFYERIYPIVLCPIPEIITSQAVPASSLDFQWSQGSRDRCLAAADVLLDGSSTWFSNEQYKVGSTPNWFCDPASGYQFLDGGIHWSRCRPFAGPDIKRCWELSRWGWAPLLIRAWRLSGDVRYLELFNDLSSSWCNSNPLNGGTNWLCGQEASIRLLHALQAWRLANASFNDVNRLAFVVGHLHRIFSSIHYAQAQQNNHWTSEAAALFIGGSLLAVSGSSHALCGRRWASYGRNALEHSVHKLVMKDGSFAQHSLTYHRLFLDTLILVELWRRWLNLDDFSKSFKIKCRAATHWFSSFVDICSGDGPNLGSNDGAFCYQLHSLPYRDFRPTLQLASFVFLEQPCLPSGPWDEPLYWYGLDPSIHHLTVDNSILRSSPLEVFSHGGYALFRPSTMSWGFLRLPVYRFRPRHADPLHFDLWHQGVNLLRDGGSYSYNSPDRDLDYFPGITSHNCVQFDGSEPMPRLGRFLWGDWLQLEFPLKPDLFDITASYICPFGRHQRQVQVDSRGLVWIISDHCSLFRKNLVLRWRLFPANWHLTFSSSQAVLYSSLAKISVSCNLPLHRIELLDGWESLYYGSKSLLPVIEVEITASLIPVSFTTEISLLGS